jgi:mannose-6-phosphate isomerase-like protein (cupin superfamily)
MKRSSFMKWGLLIGTSFVHSFSLLAQKVRNYRIGKGVKVAAGEDRFGKPISLFEGDRFFTKISSADTENDLFMWESVREVKGGPAEHFHYGEDEWFYILEGEFLFKVGAEQFTAKAGDSVFVPRMVHHAFAKTNEGKSKMLTMFQPAGKMESYFKAVSEGASKNMSDKERNDFKKSYGFEVVGPALTYEKKG